MHGFGITTHRRGVSALHTVVALARTRPGTLADRSPAQAVFLLDPGFHPLAEHQAPAVLGDHQYHHVLAGTRHDQPVLLRYPLTETGLPGAPATAWAAMDDAARLTSLGLAYATRTEAATLTELAWLVTVGHHEADTATVRPWSAAADLSALLAVPADVPGAADLHAAYARPRWRGLRGPGRG